MKADPYADRPMIPGYVTAEAFMDSERKRVAAEQKLLRAEQRLADYEQALEPFADPYNWHHNYDGTGIIFQPSGCYSDESIEPFIELARAALARHGRDEEKTLAEPGAQS